MLELKDFLEARERLREVIHITNLDLSITFSRMSGAEVYLKTENLQRTGSFKIRGAYNKIVNLDREDKQKGVITASAGNHAQGVAYAAGMTGTRAFIVMPETTPFSKVAATRGYGAEVLLCGESYDEAYQKALEIQAETGAVFIHAFDDPLVVAGQGTIGLEILEELPDADVIFVPIGGGGLAGGIAAAVKLIKPDVEIVGVEAQGAASYKCARETGIRRPLPSVRTIADGIAVKCPGELTFNLLNKYLDSVVTVDDEEIASTILLLLERAKLVVEGAGAVSLAALLYNKHPVVGKKAAVVLSGGNIDENFISLIIEKGLVKAGRRILLTTVMSDKPGNLQAFLAVIARERGNIISINHDRSQVSLPLDQALVQTVIETQGPEHGKRIIEALVRQGFHINTTSSG